MGDKSVGSLGLEGTKAPSHPQGKPRGKGKPILTLWFPWEQKQSQNQRKESRRPSLQLLTKSLILASI